jgi:hypothetical protein
VALGEGRAATGAVDVSALTGPAQVPLTLTTATSSGVGATPQEQEALRREVEGLRDHPVTAAVLYAKGEWSRFQRRERRALALLDHALAMRQRLYQQQQRPHHPEIADCLEAQAELYRAKNVFPRADSLLTSAFEARDRAYRLLAPPAAAPLDQHRSRAADNAAALGALGARGGGGGGRGGGGLDDNDDETEARAGAADGPATTCVHPATALTSQVPLLPIPSLTHRTHSPPLTPLTPVAPSTLSPRQRLAALRYAQGDFSAARALLDDALAAQVPCRALLTPLSPASLSLIPRALLDVFHALAAQERFLGPAHPEVARTANALAGLLHTVGALGEARPLYHRALDTKRLAHGPAHPEVAACLNNLGLLLQATGELDAAQVGI